MLNEPGRLPEGRTPPMLLVPPLLNISFVNGTADGATSRIPSSLYSSSLQLSAPPTKVAADALGNGLNVGTSIWVGPVGADLKVDARGLLVDKGLEWEEEVFPGMSW